MLKKPILASCSDRKQLAKTHPTLGESDHWMTSSNLAPEGLAATSFDFFVDWSGSPPVVGKELWVKRISSVDVQSVRGADVLSGAQACGDDLGTLENFSLAYGFKPRYMVFEESVDWANPESPLLAASLSGGQFSSIRHITRDQLMEVIRSCSGGPVSIGGKGLFYGTSSLECYLSGTDALWPGDADCVLWNIKEHRAVALLEFKKHNLDTPLADENIQKYMRTDRRKWERLALLRDRLQVPLSCIYYSTKPEVTEVKVERLSGPPGKLQTSGQPVYIPIADMTQAQLGRAIALASL